MYVIWLYIVHPFCTRSTAYASAFGKTHEIIGLVPRSRFLAHPRHHRHHRYGAAEFLGILGSLFFLVSFLIPIGNYVRYRRFRQQIINSGHVLVGTDGARISGDKLKATDKRLAFAKDASFDKWELDDADKSEKSNKLDDATQKEKSNEMAKNLKKMHPVDVVHNQLAQADHDSKDSDSRSVENAAFNPRSPYGGIEIVNEDADSGGKVTCAWRNAETKTDEKKIHLSCGVNYSR